MTIMKNILTVTLGTCRLRHQEDTCRYIKIPADTYSIKYISINFILKYYRIETTLPNLYIKTGNVLCSYKHYLGLLDVFRIKKKISIPVITIGRSYPSEGVSLHHTHKKLTWWLTMWDCCKLSVSLLENKNLKKLQTHIMSLLWDICEIIWWLTMQW